MKETLEKLSEIKAPVCVTIILETHKTHPDNQKDPILLKNLVSEASNRLSSEYDQATAKKYIEKLQKLASEIDHSHNDNGLVLFVNDDVSEYLRLPTHVNTRVILDDTFATRSVIRALKKDTDYYVLALARGKARLIKASSNEVLEEFQNEEFPINDKELFSMPNMDTSNVTKVDNRTQEFFNRVDKAVNRVRKEDPFSVVVYSEENNYHQYLKEVDHPNTILGHIKLQNFDDKAGNVIKYVWDNIEQLVVDKNRARITELEKALNSGNYLSDINEIWSAVQEGRGKTIFVEEGYYQPVRNDNGILNPIETNEISSKEDINDIVDDMIEHNLKFGGDVVFLKEGALNDFNKLALVTRY